MNESFIADRRSTSVEAIRARVGTAIDFTGVTTTNGLLGWSPPETGALWHAGGGQDGSLPLDRLSQVDRVPTSTKRHSNQCRDGGSAKYLSVIYLSQPP